MSPTTRQVMLWSGIVLVVTLGLCLAYLAFCDYRARYPQDVVGKKIVLKPEWRGRFSALDEDELAGKDLPRESYDMVDKIGVSDVHRVGAQGYYVAKVPLVALILVGSLLIARARYQPKPPTKPAVPIDPLAD